MSNVISISGGNLTISRVDIGGGKYVDLTIKTSELPATDLTARKTDEVAQEVIRVFLGCLRDHQATLSPGVELVLPLEFRVLAPSSSSPSCVAEIVTRQGSVASEGPTSSDQNETTTLMTDSDSTKSFIALYLRFFSASRAPAPPRDGIPALVERTDVLGTPPTTPPPASLTPRSVVTPPVSPRHGGDTEAPPSAVLIRSVSDEATRFCQDLLSRGRVVKITSKSWYGRTTQTSYPIKDLIGETPSEIWERMYQNYLKNKRECSSNFFLDEELASSLLEITKKQGS